MVSNSLENRVCLITGGASGIGKSTAFALLAAGAHVQVGDVSKSRIETLERECAMANLKRIDCWCVDVSNLAQVQAWIMDVNESKGRIDVLVHCANMCDRNRVDDQSIASIMQTMHVGFDGIVYCTKTVLPIMHQQGFGRIVYLSSIVSTLHLFPSSAAYSALKAATDAWTNIPMAVHEDLLHACMLQNATV